MPFLTGEQVKALQAAIEMARSKRGIHSVHASDGEVFAYRFNDEVYWQVFNANYAKVAKGSVPIRP